MTELQVVQGSNADPHGWSEFGVPPPQLPGYLSRPQNLQTAIPRLAKDSTSLGEIERWVRCLPTTHRIINGDARTTHNLVSGNVDLVVTSPPYWNLKKYPDEDAQARKQAAADSPDQGSRSSVTGGAQMDGFGDIVENIINRSGAKKVDIRKKARLELPGYFRPTKEWDILAIANGQLAAAIEVKSQVGSFGNNFNNRVEEAIGTATDIWVAFREGAFGSSPEPWVGYLLLLEDSPKSRNPVRVNEPHFEVFPEFRDRSYMDRYELALRKLIRERLYRSACLITSVQQTPPNGNYLEPASDLSFSRFAGSLSAHLASFR